VLPADVRFVPNVDSAIYAPLALRAWSLSRAAAIFAPSSGESDGTKRPGQAPTRHTKSGASGAQVKHAGHRGAWRAASRSARIRRRSLAAA
jgi:hypothetical protein